MKPNNRFITISDNINKIKQCLRELILAPRLNAIKWSAITSQTPNIKIGYPGQHLASLITGVRGEKTGARGNDLVDGTEVKSCSRIDQLDSCLDCNAPVSRLETHCSECGSSNISRKNDSKWLFAVRNKDDLNLLTHGVRRVLLLIGDYPNFDQGDYDTLRFQAFEIWPKHPRNAKFAEILTNYYKKIYLKHKKINPNKSPAPKNFWPYTYQFYICNPIQTFCCIVHQANSKPKIEIINYVKPETDRSSIDSVIMPPNILRGEELDLILKKSSFNDLEGFVNWSGLKNKKSRIALRELRSYPLKKKKELVIGINEKLRRFLPLRDTDKIATAKNKYRRRGFSS